MVEKMDDNERELRDLLVEQKRKLWADLRQEIFDQQGEQLHDQYSIPQDIGEQSILDLLADAGLAIADIRRTQLTQLEEAERRLEMGTYGKCEMCGEPIGFERMKAVPFAAYCVNCQRQQEPPPKGSGVTL
jgi:DnaK suppressor protein